VVRPRKEFYYWLILLILSAVPVFIRTNPIPLAMEFRAASLSFGCHLLENLPGISSYPLVMVDE
jgi:hypothetical protein